MENIEYKEEIAADELVTLNYGEYAKYVTSSKFSSVYDGLKQIHRRILWVLGTNPEKIKVSVLGGRVMDKYHPHGNASIEEAISRLAQPWVNTVPLVYSRSNVGDYSGSAVAAGRYLPVMASEFTADLFFNRVDTSALHMIPSSTGNGEYEPEYFIPVIPTALLTGASGIGIGYTSELPPLNLSALCELTKRYVEIREKHAFYKEHYKELAPLLIPDFPIKQLIRNYRQVLESYERGEFDIPLMLDGTMVLTPNTIAIKTIPWGDSMRKIYTVYGSQISWKDGFIAKNFSNVDDLSGGIKASISEANTVFTTRRGVHPLDVLPAFKKLIGFTHSWKPFPNYVGTDGKMLRCTPFDLLDIWYAERVRSILAELKSKQNRLVMKSRELSAQVLVADHSKELFNIFNSAPNKESTIPVLCKRFNLSEYQAKFLTELRFHQITGKGKEALIGELNGAIHQLQEMQGEFVRVNQRIVEDADFIDNKYGSKIPRRTMYPDFKGWVQVEDKGIIQFESFEELNQLIETWGTDKLTVQFFPKGKVHKYLITVDGVEDESKLDIPKQTAGIELIESKLPLKNTIVFGDGTVFYTPGVVVDRTVKGRTIPVPERFVITDNNFNFTLGTAAEFSKRATAKSLGILTKYTNVYRTYLGTQDDEIVVASINDKEPNIIRLEKLKLPARLSRLSIGTTTIIGICRVGDPWGFSLPLSVRGVKMWRHFYIRDTASIFVKNKLIKIHTVKKSTDQAIKLQPYKRNSNVITVEAI